MKKSLYLPLFTGLLIVCALLSNTSIRAQQQRTVRPQPSPSPKPSPNSQDQGQGSIIISTRRVQVPVAVTDRHGQFVSGLTKNDFQVLEDRVPQTIETFSDEHENLPVYVGVLMDTSASVVGKLRFEQEASMNFLQTVIRIRRDRALFGTFDDEVTLRQDFTDKLDLLDRAVFGIKKHGTHTSLYDAVWQFCDEKMRSAPGRRVLVIITDGEDTYSRATMRDAIDIAQRTNTTLFAVSTKAGLSGTTPGVEMGQVLDTADRNLQKLCEETGGQAFFSGDILSLERAFTRISNELHTQYVLTYRPTNDTYDGSYRRIEVRLTNGRNDLKIRTKHGYNATQDAVLAPQQNQ